MLQYIAIATLTLLSGTIWGWNAPLITYIHFLSVIMLFIQKKVYKGKGGISKRNFFVFLTIVAVHTINMLLVSRINPLDALNVYLCIFGAFCCAELISKQELIRKYVNVTLFMAAMSLLFWLLSRFGIVIGAKVVEPGNGFIYKLNWFFIYRDSNAVLESGINTRNFGIFWEGGAYQAFLNIAILLMIKFKKLIFPEGKLYLVKLGILVATVVTTFSTIGYFLLLLNVIIYMLENTKVGSRRRYYAVMLFLLIGIVVINSPAVANKFDSSSDSYISYIIRLNDQLGGIKAAFVSPIVGLGFNSERYTAVMHSYGIYANSSGLLIVAQQFGLIYAIWYTVVQCKGFLRFSAANGKMQTVLMLAFMLMIFSAESLNQNGVFILFLYNFKSMIAQQQKKKLSRVR